MPSEAMGDAEKQRQSAEEICETAEPIPQSGGSLWESAEAARQMLLKQFDQAEARVRHLEERIQHLEWMYHRVLTDFQRAMTKQWEVTNNVAASVREMLTTVEQMLDTATQKLRDNTPP
jgi:hypothetical protein